jgi:hypothetical protein
MRTHYWHVTPADRISTQTRLQAKLCSTRDVAQARHEQLDKQPGDQLGQGLADRLVERLPGRRRTDAQSAMPP